MLTYTYKQQKEGKRMTFAEWLTMAPNAISKISGVVWTWFLVGAIFIAIVLFWKEILFGVAWVLLGAFKLLCMVFSAISSLIRNAWKMRKQRAFQRLPYAERKRLEAEFINKMRQQLPKNPRP